MATGNFHNVNANKIFAVSFQNDNDDIEDDDNAFYDAEMQYDDLMMNVTSSLGARFKRFNKGSGTDNNELRSYPSRVIGTVSEYKQYKGFEVGIHLTAIIRSGYYDGVNLDWQLSYSIDDEDTDEPDFADKIEYYKQTTANNAKRLSSFAERWAERMAEEMIDKLEGIYGEYTDQYVITAQFSNGETMYSKVS